MSIDRRGFLKFLGFTIGSAAATQLPASEAGSSLMIPKKGPIAEPPSLAQDLLDYDRMFGKRIMVRRVEIEGARMYSRTGANGMIHDYSYARELNLRVEMYADGEVTPLIVAAYNAHEVVPIDLIVLRRAGVEQTNWYISRFQYREDAMNLAMCELEFVQAPAHDPLSYDYDDDAAIARDV